MPEEQKNVFISYRRQPASYVARSIFQDLRAHGYDVFMDVESIDSGKFEQIIFNQIEARAHFLVVLTVGTVERYADPNDMMRREIEFAIEKQRNIVPLLVNNFSFGESGAYLTGKLALVSSYNGVIVLHDYFEAAMERLRTRFLKQPMAVEIKLAPASDYAEVQRKIEIVASQPTPTEKQLSAEEHFNRGVAYYTNGNLIGAIASFTESIQLDPQNGNTYYNRGNARQENGDLSGAIADFTESIRLNPHVADVFFNRGNAHHLNGDLSDAIADFSQALRLNPDYGEAYNNRGNARKNNGDLIGAIADFDQAIRLKPQNSESYTGRGVARLAGGDLKGAITDFNRALNLNPQDADAYHNRGIVRQNNSDLSGAIADFDQALRLNPQSGDTYYMRALVRAETGDQIGAIADYSQAIRLNPYDVDAYYGRGGARHTRGDITGEIADYQQYLDLGGGQRDGDQVEIEQWIRTLKQQLNSQK